MTNRRTPGGGRALADSDYRRLAQFRYALRQLLHFSDSAAREIGLSPQQYQFLVVVRGFPGEIAPTVGDIARRLLIKHHSAVGLVDRLEAEGLLLRKRVTGDGRRVALVLTEKAERLLDSLAGTHARELRRLMPLMKSLLAEAGA